MKRSINQLEVNQIFEMYKAWIGLNMENTSEKFLEIWIGE